MNKQEIIDAYIFLREHNHDIPDDTINFMKDVALRELERLDISEVCSSCQHDGQQVIYHGPCTGCGVDDKFINFKVKL